MALNKKFAILLPLYFYLTLHFSAIAQPDILAYAGGNGRERFNAVMQLSDGTVLVAGSATNLAWIPTSVPRISIAPDSIRNELSTAQQFAFILHLSADMQNILRVVHLPQGAADDIYHIKTNSIPGQATGDLYISGNINFRESATRSGGYFLARLNNNFVNGVPTGITWARNTWAEGLHKSRQPWDVGGDGRVVYVEGQSYATDWCAIYRLAPDGSRNEVVNGWTTHNSSHIIDGTTLLGEWTPAYSNNQYVPFESLINLKIGRCSMRSWNFSEFNQLINDENGNTKRGLWPLDFFFADSCNVNFPGSTQGGPGYTGYRQANNPTPYVGGVAVDRLNNHIYLGASYQSQTSGGQPDFEPFVLAYDNNGNRKWWARMYRETTQQSPPDQYVDGLAIDYAIAGANRSLIVLGRQHGNATQSFFAGNAIVNNPLHPLGTNTFNSRFTGTNGNIHVSWLGKYRLSDGILLYSSYVAGFFGTSSGIAGIGGVSEAPNWPNHNLGNADLSDTRGETKIKTDVNGNIYLVLRSRGFTTTRNGYQQQEPPVLPANKRDSWGDYVVVYTPDLRNLIYSSMISGEWNRTEANPANGSTGGNNIDITDVFPTNGGLLMVGYHQDANNDNRPDGSLVPFNYQQEKQIAGASIVPSITPAWGRDTLFANDGESALFGRLTFAKTITANIQVNPVGGACINTPVNFSDQSFSNSGIASRVWNFGAGATPLTSTVANPVVQWATPGIKTVILTVTDSASQTASDTLFYNVSSFPPSAFTFTGPTSPAPTTLNFNGPVGANLVYQWSITDPVTGTVSNYSLQNPSHLFNTGGAGTIYPVTLTVSNAFCSSSSTQNINITGGPGSISAAFTINGSSSPITVCIGQPVTFTASNTANVTSYLWFFGENAVPSSATTAGPHQVVYTSPGVQNAVLTVGNGQSFVSSNLNLNVANAGDASFNFTGNVTSAPTVINFTANDASATAYQWNFGTPYDTANNTAIGFSASNLYTIPGEYIVSLTTTNAFGCATTGTQKITIGNVSLNPQANFYFAPSSGACVGNQVTISEVATGGQSAGAPTFEWHFGEDATPQSHLGYTPPPVIWSSPGLKIVTLRVGNSRVKSQTYRITNYPSAAFTIDTVNSNCGSPLPRRLSFKPNGGSGLIYRWDFDFQANPGALTSNSSYPKNILFTSARKYAVRLEVSSNGCKSVSVKNVTINALNCSQPNLSAGISVQPSRDGCASNSYIISSTSTGSINNYTWTGISLAGPGPQTFTGLTSGSVISLTVTDTFGGTDSISVTIP